MPGAAQAIAELDILDGRPRKSRGVEAAHLPESPPPHGAQARPEGRRVRLAVLVDEVMEQVPVA
jgi:hypothetical protein